MTKLEPQILLKLVSSRAAELEPPEPHDLAGAEFGAILIFPSGVGAAAEALLKIRMEPELS